MCIVLNQIWNARVSIHSDGVKGDVNDSIINIHLTLRKPSELSRATWNYLAARHLLASPPGHRCSVAAMFVFLPAVLVVVLSPRSAAGDPSGSTHVDGAPPSKIGQESGSLKHRLHPRNVARVSKHAEDRKLGWAIYDHVRIFREMLQIALLMCPAFLYIHTYSFLYRYTPRIPVGCCSYPQVAAAKIS